MLYDKIKQVIQGKQQGIISQGAVLLHGNACPHTAARAVQTFQ